MAESYLGSIDTYRSYVINYGYGQHMVRDLIEAATGRDAVPAAEWQAVEALLSTPFHHVPES